MLLPALAFAVFLVIFLGPRSGLYFMAALMPVQYFLVLGSGATIIRFVGWVVFAAWAVQKLVQKASLRSILNGPLTRPILAFLYLCFISVAWSSSTFWDVGFFSYLQLVMWVFMVVDLIDTQPRLERLLFFLSAGVLISAYILLQEFLTRQAGWEFGTVAEGGFGDRNTTAASFLYVLPFLFYWIQWGNLGRKIVGVASVVLLLIGVGISASRTNLLILPVLLILQARSIPNPGRKAQYLLIIGILLAISTPFWPWAQIDYRFSNIWTGGNPEDLGGRIRTMGLALDQFLQSPLLGRGLGGYRMKYTIAAHNLFLEIAAQLGILGLLSMVWLWIAAWRHLVAARLYAQRATDERLSSLIRSVQISLIVFFLFSLSMSSQSLRLLWLTFALSGVCYNIAYRKPSDNAIAPPRRGSPTITQQLSHTGN